MLLYLVFTLLLPHKFNSIMMSGEYIDGTLRALEKSFDLLEFLLAVSFLLLSLNELFTIASNATLAKDAHDRITVIQIQESCA